MGPRKFRQSRWPPPVPGCRSNRSVFQFCSGSGRAEHQPASAHIAAPDEVRRKHEILTEYLQEWGHILPGGDTPQQNEETLRTRVLPNELRIPLERIAEIRIAV